MSARPRTLPEALAVGAAEHPQAVLLECDGREVTVAELERRSASVAAGLAGLGIQPGDRVAVMMRNVPEFVFAWFGILRAGAIEVPVHCAYKGPQLDHVLAESGARLFVCDEEFAERLEGLELPALREVIVRGRLLELEREFADAAPPAVPVDPRAISCILYTSGTTGRSKGVALPHSANMRLAETVIELMDYGPRDVLYTAFPLFHVNAKFTSVAAALLSGARLVLDERFSASAFWERMRSRRVTAFNYMGSMLTILAKQPEHPDDGDNPVTRCYGAACPPALWESFERRFGVSLREHYGMTEIGIATMNTATERRVGSIGRAAPYFDIRVADADGNAVPDGTAGELQVRPREPGALLDHYWGRLDATAAAFRDLWFHTGDLGSRDADGFFYFHDRSKDAIRRRGENVSSFEVESVVNSHPDVLESAAFGVPSELGEEEVAIAVVAQPGAAVEPAPLLDHAQARLPYFAVPRYVLLVDELPKTDSQRIQKFRLRERGVDGAFDAASAGYVVHR